VRIFDPQIQLDAIYGSNRQFILDAIPHISGLLARDLPSLLGWADGLVLTQKPSPEAAASILASQARVLDLALVLPGARARPARH